MSLPDVSFTNNLGTLTFARCLIGVTDNWEFDGRVARHVKSISIDGHIERNGVGEGFQELLTDRTTFGKRYGGLGTLTLPWTNLSNIRFQDLGFPTNTWIDFVPVQATFADEWPDFNSYTLSFFGLTIYNPRLVFPIPMRGLRDEYALMPQKYGVGFQLNDPRVGVFRNRSGQRNMDITLSGTIQVNDNILPANLQAILTQRVNMGLPNTFTYILPTGYPCPFNLGDAIPELTKDMNLAQVFVVGSQVVWHIEEQTAQVTIQMMCPPQVIGA
jgi:hypothetical protein